MSGIAKELDAKLKSLDPRAASSLEKLVRDVLDLVDTQRGTMHPDRLPQNFFARISEEFGTEPFERPSQGDSDKRQDW